MKSNNNNIDKTLIYANWRDIDYVRTKGNTGRQAPVVKEQAIRLGRASAISARLRASFKPLVPGKTDRKMMYRLNHALQQWLKTGQEGETAPLEKLPFLTGFSFHNDGTGSDQLEVMSLGREADGNLILLIPAIYPSGPFSRYLTGGKISFSIIASSCNLTDLSDVKSTEVELECNYPGDAQTAQKVKIPLQAGAHKITAVAVSVNFSPLGIAGALYN